MSLCQCPDCKQFISSSIKACLYCGASTEAPKFPRRRVGVAALGLLALAAWSDLSLGSAASGAIDTPARDFEVADTGPVALAPTSLRVLANSTACATVTDFLAHSMGVPGRCLTIRATMPAIVLESRNNATEMQRVMLILNRGKVMNVWVSSSSLAMVIGDKLART